MLCLRPTLPPCIWSPSTTLPTRSVFEQNIISLNEKYATEIFIAIHSKDLIWKEILVTRMNKNKKAGSNVTSFCCIHFSLHLYRCDKEDIYSLKTSEWLFLIPYLQLSQCEISSPHHVAQIYFDRNVTERVELENKFDMTQIIIPQHSLCKFAL